MPVMEGKCVLFKEFGGVDAFPLCIRSKNVDDIVNIIAFWPGGFWRVTWKIFPLPAALRSSAN